MIHHHKENNSRIDKKRILNLPFRGLLVLELEHEHELVPSSLQCMVGERAPMSKIIEFLS